MRCHQFDATPITICDCYLCVSLDFLLNLDKIYHGESGQPPNEQGPMVANIMNSLIVNSLN